MAGHRESCSPAPEQNCSFLLHQSMTQLSAELRLTSGLGAPAAPPPPTVSAPALSAQPLLPMAPPPPRQPIAGRPPPPSPIAQVQAGRNSAPQLLPLPGQAERGPGTAVPAPPPFPPMSGQAGSGMRGAPPPPPPPPPPPGGLGQAAKQPPRVPPPPSRIAQQNSGAQQVCNSLQASCDVVASGSFVQHKEFCGM